MIWNTSTAIILLVFIHSHSTSVLATTSAGSLRGLLSSSESSSQNNKNNQETATTGARRRDDERIWCCSTNFRECSTAEWCHQGGANRCEDSCHGYWIKDNHQEETSCIARWEGGCSNNEDSCCEGLACVQWIDSSWIACGIEGIDGPAVNDHGGSTATSTPTTASPTTSVPTSSPPTMTPSTITEAPSTPSPTSEPTRAPITVAPSTNMPTNNNTTSSSPSSSSWAFEESFDGQNPSSPSQDLLPSNMEFVITYRSHPGRHFDDASYAPFLADHDDTCRGPDPSITPLRQHMVYSNQRSTGSNPDASFYICNSHMMSALGSAGQPYGLSAFWPRQEFDFGSTIAAGGTGIMEFDVNINDDHGVRSWWEIVIAPRSQLKFAPGPVDSPISETYPIDRIVLDFRRNVRTIKVGTGALAPNGWIAKHTQRGPYDYAWWRNLHPNDPALDDHRLRRKMRVLFSQNTITWGIETPDGSFDEFSVDLPGTGLPFTQGLVLFKTHAYNPEKDGNLNIYSFHWDNIRWNGPVTGLYNVYEASNVVYLQRDGPRPIGDTATVTIDLPVDPHTLQNPALVGQIHHPMIGQVLVSINGGPNIAVQPFDYGEPSEIFGPSNDGCSSRDWKSFRLPLDNTVTQTLIQGTNTLQWTVGPRPACARSEEWDGYSVKFLQIQSDSL